MGVGASAAADPDLHDGTDVACRRFGAIIPASSTSSYPTTGFASLYGMETAADVLMRPDVIRAHMVAGRSGGLDVDGGCGEFRQKLIRLFFLGQGLAEQIGRVPHAKLRRPR